MDFISCYDRSHAERIDYLEDELQAARETIKRLSAPVSDQEWAHHGTRAVLLYADEPDEFVYRDDLDALIQSRLNAPADWDGGAE